MDQWLQILGALMVLAGFVAAQLRALPPQSYTYLLLNLAGCMLARVDGKSQVEYLSERQRGTVRDLGTRWLREPPASWKAALGAF